METSGENPAPSSDRHVPQAGAFVCAFLGRRDSYQVPVALAENGLLDQFITDIYASPVIRKLALLAPARIGSKLASRFHPAIPSERVRCLWGAALLENARHRLGVNPRLTHMRSDRHISEAAAMRAAKQRSNLFLYSPYAWEAFTAKYRHYPFRVLFQYHPHPDLEARLLSDDAIQFQSTAEIHPPDQDQSVPDELLRRERNSWRYADLIICASSFTKRSLIDDGCDERLCRVIPYGIHAPSVLEGRPPAEEFNVVFVGSGCQRKGLHHLILAWRQLSLKRPATLTLICRALDSGIERMIASTPRVILRRGVPAQELNRLYATSTLFVMPSLVEGFGQVYLEAMAQGCPVLGTSNTGLPDIGSEADGVFLVAPGSIDEMLAKLENLSQSLPANLIIRQAAQKCAAQFTWPRFRRNLIEAILK